MKTTQHLTLALAALVGFQAHAHAQAIVDLGTASSFGVLAGASITSTGSTVINGDLGLSPGTAVTGFTGVGAGGDGIVNGSVYVADATAAQAQLDLTSAYNFVEGHSAGTVVAAFADETITSGVYRSASSIGITGALTLDGQNQANPIFYFQMGSTLTTAVGSQILLINGAQAEHIYWQVGTSATLGTDSTFSGTILAFTDITAGVDATIDGRLLARNGTVSLSNNLLTVPSAIPEPASASLLVASAVALLAATRRNRRVTPAPQHV